MKSLCRYRYLWFAFLVFGGAMCSPPKSEDSYSAFQPQLLMVPANFSVRDTVEYTHGPMGGALAHLYYNDAFIDSIDTWFGLHAVGKDLVVFSPVKAYPDEPYFADITGYVVFNGKRKTLLNTFLPYFNDYFSSPTVSGSTIYYWGLASGNEEDFYRFLAMRYDFSVADVESLYLETQDLGTDDQGYFNPPEFNAEGIIYQRSDAIRG